MEVAVVLDGEPGALQLQDQSLTTTLWKVAQVLSVQPGRERPRRGGESERPRAS